MINLKDKTVIVTGSSRGLGKQIAIEFAKKGANVVINYNSNESEALSTVKEITLNEGKAIAVKANVSQNEDVNHLFEKTIEHFGKVDIVVNNAGIMMTKFLKDFSEEEFDKQFTTNVKSVFFDDEKSIR
ncbi:SDR family NAD(P)-dependent oxidoreductase [Empedobacter brevis]|uniref:SDR family NAD(P)-dependent oxidoreductase n=1 Tax=Empedobacter brevis TaxID=247 RepID=UPI0033401EFB